MPLINGASWLAFQSTANQWIAVVLLREERKQPLELHFVGLASVFADLETFG